MMGQLTYGVGVQCDMSYVTVTDARMRKLKETKVGKIKF
jgi:hypothetical protein